MVPYEILFSQLRRIQYKARTPNKIFFSFFFLFLGLFYGLQKTTLVTYWKGLILPLKHHFQSAITLQHPPHSWILLLEKMCVCVYFHNHDPTDFISFVCLSQLHQQQEDNFRHSLQHPPASKSKVESKDCVFWPKVHTNHKTPWAAKFGGPKFKAKFLDFFTLSQRSLAAFSLFYLASTICLSASSRSGCSLFINTYFLWPSIACSLE